MVCSLLILSVISISFRLVMCNTCCENFRCTLISDETLCNSNAASECHWIGKGCVGKTCADYDEASCFGSHNAGIYTDEFYCKWDGSNCVAGTADCSNYNNNADYCYETGKCRHDGTNCVSASSCSEFSEEVQCNKEVLNGVRCLFKNSACIPFACSEVTADGCITEESCYVENSACVPITNCNLLNQTGCQNKKDVAGNDCIWINKKCRKWECGNYVDKTNCTFFGCHMAAEKCVKLDVACSSPLAGSADVCNSLGCYFIKKCPIDPNRIIHTPSSAMIIYVPGLLVVFLFVFLMTF